jgi:hypothetical protein
MSLASGITMMGRKQAELLMESTCVIKRQTGTTPDSNGVEVPTYSTIYTGKCRFRMPDARSNTIVAAGQSLTVQSPTLSIPVTASGSASVRTDDVAVITVDSSTVTARIAGIHSQTHSTARRFPVEVTL